MFVQTFFAEVFALEVFFAGPEVFAFFAPATDFLAAGLSAFLSEAAGFLATVLFAVDFFTGALEVADFEEVFDFGLAGLVFYLIYQFKFNL